MMTAGALEFPEEMSEFNVEDVKSRVKAWFFSKLDGEEGCHFLDTLGRYRTAALKERKMKKRDEQKKKKEDEKITSVKIKELKKKPNELF